jgi:hypothetical protein
MMIEQLVSCIDPSIFEPSTFVFLIFHVSMNLPLTPYTPFSSYVMKSD